MPYFLVIIIIYQPDAKLEQYDLSTFTNLTKTDLQELQQCLLFSLKDHTTYLIKAVLGNTVLKYAARKNKGSHSYNVQLLI